VLPGQTWRSAQEPFPGPVENIDPGDFFCK
jgi:hypothetical protein